MKIHRTTSGTASRFKVQPFHSERQYTSGPTPIFCDNTAAKKVAENPVSAKNLRHVARRHFFVQDAWRAGDVVVPSIESKRNRADVLTKLMDTPSYYEASIKNFLSTAP